MSVEIINLHEENIDEYGIGCIRNKKHPGVKAKIEWAKSLFQEGLTIKLLLKNGKQIGFIEYIPGLHTWRPLNAIGYLVIHCIWIFKTDEYNKGYASMLIKEAIDDAIASKRKGVVTIASEGSWLVSPQIYEKNGFYKIDSRGRYDLMAYLYKEAPLARFKPRKKETNIIILTSMSSKFKISD
jgi:ribosomal protein S18 acetylase RimI-like enzyme